jgi:hypothetical protein
MIGAQHQRALAIRFQVMLAEILARGLAHQWHGGGIERDGRRGPRGRNVGWRRQRRWAKRPHHVIADRVCHAAIGLTSDRDLALHGLVALFQRDAARRLGVDAARGDGKDAPDVDRQRLGSLGTAVVLEQGRGLGGGGGHEALLAE